MPLVRAQIAHDGTDSVHRGPPPRIVTTRTSLFDEAGCRQMITNSEKKKQKYFCW
jgi:hypothetical protein